MHRISCCIALVLLACGCPGQAGAALAQPTAAAPKPCDPQQLVERVYVIVSWIDVPSTAELASPMFFRAPPDQGSVPMIPAAAHQWWRIDLWETATPLPLERAKKAVLSKASYQLRPVADVAPPGLEEVGGVSRCALTMRFNAFSALQVSVTAEPDGEPRVLMIFPGKFRNSSRTSFPAWVTKDRPLHMFADFGQGCIVELNFRKDEVPPGLSRVKLYGRLPSTCKGTPFIKHLTSHVPPGGIGFRRISP